MNSPEPCALIGILDDGHAGLGDAARHRIAAADLVIGAGRTLELVRPHLAPTTECRDMDGKLGQVSAWILAARDQGKATVALANKLTRIIWRVLTDSVDFSMNRAFAGS